MLEISIVVILLVISGAFSGTEVAFTSLTVDQLERMKRDYGKRGQMVADLYDELDLVLTSITIGNNLANLAASALVSALTIRLFGEAWLAVSTAALTMAVLVFGEVTPKQIGIFHNEYVTRHLARFLRVFSWVFAPVIWIIRMVSNALTSLSGGRARPRVTAESLRHLVRYAGSTGVLKPLHASIVKNVIRSQGVRIEAVMTHRTRMVTMERRALAAEVLPKMLESRFSRFPVYDEHPERIVGVVLLRDVARAVIAEDREATLGRLMTKPLYVLETRTLHQVLNQLQREHVNMAIVLDEYGGVSGVVTMEDLVEEFVGELYDENEIEKAKLLSKTGENEYWIAGEAPIHVANDFMETELPNLGDAQTVGGYVTEHVGRIPAAGERIEDPQGTFTVEEVSHSRIVALRFRKNNRSGD